jgi:hypothetical protein
MNQVECFIDDDAGGWLIENPKDVESSLEPESLRDVDPRCHAVGLITVPCE